MNILFHFNLNFLIQFQCKTPLLFQKPYYMFSNTQFMNDNWRIKIWYDNLILLFSMISLGLQLLYNFLFNYSPCFLQIAKYMIMPNFPDLKEPFCILLCPARFKSIYIPGAWSHSSFFTDTFPLWPLFSLM